MYLEDDAPPGHTPLLHYGKNQKILVLEEKGFLGLEPLRAGKAPALPGWITERHDPGQFNDFLVRGGTKYTPEWVPDQFWVGIMSIRGNLMFLSGLGPIDQTFKVWSASTYSTFTIPTDMAEELLTPKFSKGHLSALERLRLGVGVV
jgi:hypothetical protein